jgi:uncharacterized protein YgiM (DUF1202 family)
MRFPQVLSEALSSGTTMGLAAFLSAVTLVGSTSTIQCASAEATAAKLLQPSAVVSNEKRLLEAERSLLEALAVEDARPAPQAAALSAGTVQEPVAAPAEVALKDPQPAEIAPAAPEKKRSGAGRAAAASRAPSAPAKLVEVAQPQDLTDTRSKLTTAESTNATLELQLRETRARIEELEQQLDESRSQLSLAETEVARLSAISDSKTRASLGKYNLPLPSAQNLPQAAARPAPAAPRAAARNHSAQPVAEVRPPAPDADLHVATVSVDKADLRLGPGKSHSALMSVRRGSRLMVEARQGEWYRVFAPNGDRAWIATELVTFGDGASSLNDGSSVRVKGFKSGAEEEAFRRVQRAGTGR